MRNWMFAFCLAAACGMMVGCETTTGSGGGGSESKEEGSASRMLDERFAEAPVDVDALPKLAQFGPLPYGQL